MESCRTVYEELVSIWNKVIIYLDETEINSRQRFFEYILENQNEQYVKEYCLKIIDIYIKYLHILSQNPDNITKEDVMWLINYNCKKHIVRPYIIIRYFEIITDIYLRRRNRCIEEFYVNFLQNHWYEVYEKSTYKEKIKKVLKKINYYVEKELAKEKQKKFSREMVKRIKRLQIFKIRVESLLELV